MVQLSVYKNSTWIYEYLYILNYFFNPCIPFKRRTNYIKTKADLERVVTEVWTSLPLHYIQSLYISKWG